MVELNFRNYKRNNTDPYSSDFLNQVTDDFSNNMVKLYMEYKRLVKEYNNFNSAANIGLDWLYQMVGVLSTQSYVVTGYADPVSSTSLILAKLYGQFYLDTTQATPESKIGRYTDAGKELAYTTNKVYKYEIGIWVEDTDLRIVIDNHDNIWQELRDDNELYIAVAIPTTSTEQKANIIEVVPFAGTLIKKIEWKTPSGTFEQVLPNSKLPVQLVGRFDFTNEIRVLLGGVVSGSKYYYALRYIDAYTCDFVDEGQSTYSIGDFDEITSIELNDDYIREDLKIDKPVRIEIISNDESLTYYDSNVDPFPIQSTIPISGSPIPVKCRVTLYKKEGITPLIKYVDIQ